MNYEEILSPVSMYRSRLREEHDRNSAEAFDELLRRSGIDEAANRELVERIRKLEDSMMEYHKAAAVIREHKKLIFGMFIVTLVQRIIHFSITYLIYRGLGLSALSAADVIALQCIISISVDMLPLPGGMGISEGLFLSIFRRIFTGGLLYPAMLLSRGISYYALLLISAAMTGVAHLTIKQKE